MKQGILQLAVLGSTRGTGLQAIITAIESGRLPAAVALVASNRPDAFILQRAQDHHIPAQFVDPQNSSREQYDQQLLQLFTPSQPDYILLIGYMKILSPLFVRAFKDRILNIHPSLLPAFAGGMDRAVHEAVLASGVTETGCTIHLVDEGVDSGRILLQKRCAVLPRDTTDSIKARVQDLEKKAWVELLFSLARKKIYA